MMQSAQKHHDQEQREQMDKMRSNGGTFDRRKNYGTFDHSRPNNGPDEMFEMFTNGPFQR